jgi:hypothetical protein
VELAQSKRLAALAGGDTSRSDALEESLIFVLTQLQSSATRFSFPNHELSSRKSQAVVIDDKEALAPEWLAVTTTSNPDKAAIKEALKAGRAPFALGPPRFRSSVIRPRQRLVTPAGAAAGSLKALLAHQIIAGGIPAEAGIIPKPTICRLYLWHGQGRLQQERRQVAGAAPFAVGASNQSREHMVRERNRYPFRSKQSLN